MAGLAMLPAAKKITLSSFEDIMAALRSPELGLRLAVLRALEREPAHVEKHSPALRDYLVGQLREPDIRSEHYVLALLTTLWKSPVPDVFWECFATTSEPDVLTICANRLALEPPHTLVERLVALLGEETHPSRAMLVAQMLARQSALPAGVRVQVAVLAPVEAAPPPWGDEVLDEWLRCLHDATPFPTSQKAKALLTIQKHAGSLDWLATHWTRLHDDVKCWLVREARDRAPLVARAMLEAGVAEKLADEVASLDHSLVDWAALWDGDLRHLAIRYGAPRPDPKNEWEQSSRDEQRIELLKRYPTDLDWLSVARQNRPVVRNAALQALAAQSATFRSDVLTGLGHAGDHEEVALFRALAAAVLADGPSRG